MAKSQRWDSGSRRTSLLAGRAGEPNCRSPGQADDSAISRFRPGLASIFRDLRLVAW